MDITQLANVSFHDETHKLSPLQALLLLFSYPYCNLVSQFFLRTREHEAGLMFVDRCIELLEQCSTEIPYEKAQRIERDVAFLKLALFDALNLWQEYLDYFEEIFQCRRNGVYIGEFVVDSFDKPSPDERFGRYLIRPSEMNLLPPKTSSSALVGVQDMYELEVSQSRKKRVFVHELYLHENRRAIIERKLCRKKAGKSVEHLKRHQKEQLSSEEQHKRFAEMERLFQWMKKS